MDALAALNIWAYETSFPGVTDDDDITYVFRIDPHPAADWLIATLEVGHLSYLPGMLTGNDRELMLEAIEDGRITVAELEQENREALEAASGWKWYSAAKLIGLLHHSWESTGAVLMLQGVDPRHVSLGAFLGALYGLYWRDASKEGRQTLATFVATPPLPKATDAAEFDEAAAEEAVWETLKQMGHNLPS